MAKIFNAPPKQAMPVKQVQQAVNLPFNPFANVPQGWNPSLPPPTINPTRGIPVQPEAYQYPGAIFGSQWEDVQQLIRKQNKTFGFTAIVAATSITNFAVKLSGTAKILLGMKMTVGTPAFVDPSSTFDLIVNNERIINAVPVLYFNNDFSVNSAVQEYVSFPRPLSGNDDITLVVNEIGALPQNYEMIFYYL